MDTKPGESHFFRLISSFDSSDHSQIMSPGSDNIRTDKPNPPLTTALGPPLLPPPPLSTIHQPFGTQDHSSTRQLPHTPVSNGRPRGHTLADTLSSGGGSNARKFFCLNNEIPFRTDT